MPFPSLQDLPTHFYKYRSLRGDELNRTLDIIENNRLFWSSPLDFNDPFDCVPVYSMEGSALKKEYALRKIYREHIPGLTKVELRPLVEAAKRLSLSEFKSRMAEGQREWLAETAVCCLSTVPDNILMWTHYADAHSGICLRFRPLSQESELVTERLMHFEYALPVQYTDKRPIINVLKRSPEESLNYALLTKADFWGYENEWRMIGYRQGPGYRDFPPACLDGVIFGARVSAGTRKIVLERLAKRDVSVEMLNAEFDGDHFKLNLSAVQA